MVGGDDVRDEDVFEDILAEIRRLVESQQSINSKSMLMDRLIQDAMYVIESRIDRIENWIRQMDKRDDW